ncbi:MAG: replication-associated recombination protein A [Oligoflexia bacterium]|nr:replication-associated recombination protein A [Oligoflexia bacterium]
MEDLFTFNSTQEGLIERPLSERVRPESFEHFVGHQNIISGGLSLKNQILKDKIHSLILWGPPGCGKTSLAVLISKLTKSNFVSRSAIDTGAKELKEEGEKAKYRLQRNNEKTILFIDEIHRLNRAQQDCLLPYVEKGDLTLIGATTENPSFEINSALLSRCQVIVLNSLSEGEINKILNRACFVLQEGLSLDQLADEEAQNFIFQSSQGDARRALNILERVYEKFIFNSKSKLNLIDVSEIIQKTPVNYDKHGEFHYNIISSFIKSIRGSDPNAALFYLARMLEGGEDPLFIARRLVILASEDVGNADPRGIQVAIAVKEAVEFVGLPEAAINLAQGVTYLASSPKSNRSYKGLKAAQNLVKKHPSALPPKNILNAPTKLMKNLGYGEDYRYDHDEEMGISKQNFLPEGLQNQILYDPKESGYEKNIKAYLDWVNKIRHSEKK